MAQLELLLEEDGAKCRYVELPAGTRDKVVALMQSAMVAVLEDEREGDDEGPGKPQDRS